MVVCQTEYLRHTLMMRIFGLTLPSSIVSEGVWLPYEHVGSRYRVGTLPLAEEEDDIRTFIWPCVS